jgi:hypothetical protein
MVEEFKIHVDYEKDSAVPVIFITGEITSEADEDNVNSYASIPNEKRSRVLIDFSKTLGKDF